MASLRSQAHMVCDLNDVPNKSNTDVELVWPRFRARAILYPPLTETLWYLAGPLRARFGNLW
eukprot:373943-Alexandrium_andersonii.AAC.1